MQIGAENLQIIGEFTYRFLRLERYLVDLGYVKPGKVPFPDWSRYNNEKIKPTEIIGTYAELSVQISKRRVTDVGKIEWVGQKFDQNGDNKYHLLENICSVRDNLFHGSKLLNDSERDLKLIEEAILFLKELETLDSEYSKYL